MVKHGPLGRAHGRQHGSLQLAAAVEFLKLVHGLVKVNLRGKPLPLPHPPAWHGDCVRYGGDMMSCQQDLNFTVLGFPSSLRSLAFL